MEKAILVLDMPKNCYECKLQVCDEVGERLCVINNRNADYCASKDDECPLKEPPEKWDFQDYSAATYRNWMKGFNSCLDKILNGGKENV